MYSEITDKWKILWVVMIGTMMSSLDASIINVSIPAIMADFGVNLSQIEWVITSYMLAFAVLMPLATWYRERIGNKKMYIASLMIFTIGSLLCGLSWNLPMMILARIIQAIGGAAIAPTSMALITETFEHSDRNKAIGYWGMSAMMGITFGPTIGGILTKQFGWPSIFLINLPIGLLGIYFAFHLLKEETIKKEKLIPFDVPGFIFLGLFISSFLMGMSKGGTEGWLSVYVITCALIAFFSFVGFMLVETQVPHPIMNLNLLKNPVFAACFSLTAIRSVALYGGSFLLPIFLQNFKKLDEVQSGLILLPGSLLLGLLLPYSGRLSEKQSPKIMGFIGFTLLGFCFFQYRNITIETSNWEIIWPTLVRGIGFAMLITPLTATAMNAVSKKDSSMASSMLNMIQQVGGSVGIAMLSLTLHTRTTYHLNHLGSEMSTSTSAYRDALNNIIHRALDLGYTQSESIRIGTGQVANRIAQSAAVQGFQDSFLVASMITFVIIALCFYLPSKPIVPQKNEVDRFGEAS